MNTVPKIDTATAQPANGIGKFTVAWKRRKNASNQTVAHVGALFGDTDGNEIPKNH